MREVLALRGGVHGQCGAPVQDGVGKRAKVGVVSDLQGAEASMNVQPVLWAPCERTQSRGWTQSRDCSSDSGSGGGPSRGPPSFFIAVQLTDNVRFVSAVQQCSSQFLKVIKSHFGASQGGEDPLEEEMAPHSSLLAWRISWTEEPGGATVHGVAET